VTTAWKNIDSGSAESRLRGLRRRLADLDEALQGQQKILRNNPESFAFKLSCESLLQIQGRLQSELVELVRYRNHETVKFALQGAEFADSSASLRYIGTFILRLQKLYTSLAQAITTGPTQRGPVPQIIQSATNLRLATVFSSSFGMEMFVPSDFDMLGHSVASEALDALFQLLKSTSDEDTLKQRAGEYGSRSTNHLAHLAKALRSADAILKVDWTDYSGTKHEWISNQAATDIVIAYYTYTTASRSELKVLDGRLVGASLLRNRFELLLQDGTSIEGKFIAGLAPAITRAFGTICRATVDETEVRDQATQQSRLYYSLIVLEPSDAQA
jgi:hypothetical protein